MSAAIPGDNVLDLVKSANERLVMAAPYIKSSTLRRLLNAIPETVSECVCITRWLPEDIASGVCDIGIFDDLKQTRGGCLMVHPHLHAKYYSNGQQTLIGSANLTARGLGWHAPSNVELIVTLPVEFAGLAEWEQLLLGSAVQATEQLRDHIRTQAEALKQAKTPYHIPEVEEDTAEKGEPALWVPKCPAPERLWQVYRGHGADTMVTSAFEAAESDIASLAPPPGLTEEIFTAYIAGIFRQMPVLLVIDKLSATGLTDDKAHDLLADQIGKTSEKFDPAQSWHIIKQWLTHFLPETYRLETKYEVLVKGRELPRS